MMAERGEKAIDFVPMSTISKTTDGWDDRCTHWVATEKVHGSSFQLYTDDGVTVHSGSRRRNLDIEDSFLKCNIHDLVEEYRACVTKLWDAVISDDRWNRYREISTKREESDIQIKCESEAQGIQKPRRCEIKSENEKESKFINESCFGRSTKEDNPDVELHEHCTKSISDRNNVKEVDDSQIVSSNSGSHIVSATCFGECNREKSTKCSRCNIQGSGDSSGKDLNNTEGDDINNDHQSNNTYKECEKFQLRIYGELYGGGGVGIDTKKAIQKEIIYCDNFRFYVFGVTINRKWLTISELGALCKKAGFPYYAKPVNEVPMETVDGLKRWLEESGLMTSRSALTERRDEKKTYIEGFVLTPLTKTDYRLHAIKYLAPAFNDVRTEQRTNKKTKTVYCTKQRYHSVISKLDEDERRDREMVVDMMIADIIAESQETDPSKKQQKIWRKMVVEWLRNDGYTTLEDERENRGWRKESKKENENGFEGERETIEGEEKVANDDV